jgi:signal transduction histidine kinase
MPPGHMRADAVLMRQRALRRIRFLAVLVGAFAVAITAAAVINSLRHNADEALRESRLTSELRTLAGALVAIESMPPTDASQTVGQAVIDWTRTGVDRTLAELAAIDAGDAEEFGELFDTSFGLIARRLDLAQSGGGPGLALVQQDMRVAADSLFDTLAEESAEHDEIARETAHRAEVGTYATLLAAAALVAALFWLLDRSRRRRARTEAARLGLETENERLLELDRMKSHLVATVSHELRTPLTSIRGYLELLLESGGEPLSDEQRRVLRIVDRNGARLLHVVNDLLFVSKGASGTIELDRVELHLHEVVDETAAALRQQAEGKGVALRVALDAAPQCIGDPTRLGQAVENLVANAIKFTPAGGTVDVTLSTAGESTVLEIADTGLGIAPSDQERLFQPFFRAGSAISAAIPGTGLGLSIAKAIVEAHGGEIVLQSALGRGTTFTVRLPLAAAKVGAMAA